MYTEHTNPEYEETCCDCGATMPLRVCQSAAGYYLGYFCLECGPYDRYSGYYRTKEEAVEALKGYCGPTVF